MSDFSDLCNKINFNVYVFGFLRRKNIMYYRYIKKYVV